MVCKHHSLSMVAKNTKIHWVLSQKVLNKITACAISGYAAGDLQRPLVQMVRWANRPNKKQNIYHTSSFSGCKKDKVLCQEVGGRSIL